MLWMVPHVWAFLWVRRKGDLRYCVVMAEMVVMAEVLLMVMVVEVVLLCCWRGCFGFVG